MKSTLNDILASWLVDQDADTAERRLVARGIPAARTRHFGVKTNRLLPEGCFQRYRMVVALSPCRGVTIAAGVDAWSRHPR
jgi:hypothetical protein